MNVESTDFVRLFTVDEANATLPLVSAICRDLSALSREVVERRERLSFLLAGRDTDAEDLYREELTQIEEELNSDNRRLEEYLQELRDLGVEPKNGIEGLVDFPAEMDGKVVYLCWKLGEPEVLYWHDIDAGFRGRQPLTADSGAATGPSGEGLDGGADDLA